MEDPPQFRQQPAPQAPARNKAINHGRGARRVCLKRGENGFGFTLRHFIAYPPDESVAHPNERMETIFIKNIPEGSTAALAGLMTGDRILSVNGEKIEGIPYSNVVQMISNSPERLVLVVVPKEEDVLQQHFSDTHNPKTNSRPRLRSPEIRRGSSSSPAGPRSLPTSSLINEPIYHTPVWSDRSSSGSRSSTGRRQSEAPQTVISSQPSVASSSSGQPGCRLSLDGSHLSSSGGSLKSFESNSTLTDDSHIMSRIKRICEQKEEFLRNHVKPENPLRETGNKKDGWNSEAEFIAREFYARPQRMQMPAWPPEEIGKQVGRTLSRIHEGTPAEASNRGSFGANSFDSDPGEVCRVSQHFSRSRSEEKEVPSRRSMQHPVTQVVSQRTRQFESGQLEEDRTPLYKSELARLTGKRSVPNVAVRRQEFEQRSSQERSPRILETPPRPSDSSPSSPPLPTSSSFLPSSLMSGNRTVPVGSKHLHVAPPADYRDLTAGTIHVFEERRSRGRSSSSDRWASLDDNQSRPITSVLSPPTDRRIYHSLSPDCYTSAADKQRHKAVRQDSYLAAVKTIPGPTAARARRVVRRQPSLDSADLKEVSERVNGDSRSPRSKTRALRPKKLSLRPPSPLSDAENESEVPVTTVPITTMAESVVRRVKSSSLSVDERATRRVSYLKATLADTDHDPVSAPPKSSGRKWLYPMLPGEIQRLRRIFEEYSGYAGFSSHITGIDNSEKKGDVLHEGPVHFKISSIEGKRATDRSWRQLFAALRGTLLTLKKDQKDASESDSVNVRGCKVEVLNDYKKRNHVIRLRTPVQSEYLPQKEVENEYLLQAESLTDLELWRTALEKQSDDPDKPPRSSSPTGQSPKTRKASQPAGVPDQLPSPKSKTWKGKLGKPFRRMQGGTASSPTHPEGASIGVPIDRCPPSPLNGYVSLLVTRCTTVVETRGLDIIGVYRVPGNKAAIAALTEAVNKGIDNIPPDDPRWHDVNVVSSLLKSFFRCLPDCLFTAELYPSFIAADKTLDQRKRMTILRNMVKELPNHNYETLKHILYHLKKIVSNCSVNKMESKNLAIVFGPTLLKAADLITMVQDTAHQCRIVESLISHVDWFFSDDDVECLESTSLPPPSENAQIYESSQSATLLLNNLAKVGGYRGDHSPNKDLKHKDLVSNILSAANRISSLGRMKRHEKLDSCYESVKSEIEMVSNERIESSILSGGSISRGAEPGPQQPGVHSHDPVTLERIHRFKVETEAALARDCVSIRRCLELRAETERHHKYDTRTTTIDLNGGHETLMTRKVGSCESLNEDATSLKRFKSSREDCSSHKFGSLDSLQAASNIEDGHDLLKSITDTFEQKLQILKLTEDESCLSITPFDELTTEKAEIEVLDEKESKQCGDEEKDKDSIEERDKAGRGDDRREVLKPRVWNDNPRVKRSESLNKADKPELAPKVRRSESLGKTDVRRNDFLTKNEKTETNMKAKLKRSSSKEKENSAAKLKRIKRRHTVGGTKDLDKLHMMDNRLYTEALERQAATKQTRTSSPDLSSAKLRNSLANELISLGADEQIEASEQVQLISQAVSRPQSMPPPLESHI